MADIPNPAGHIKTLVGAHRALARTLREIDPAFDRARFRSAVTEAFVLAYASLLRSLDPALDPAAATAAAEEAARLAVHQITRRDDDGTLGVSPFADLSAIVTAERPVVFDVGANVGQTIASFRKQMPQAVIHAFEPMPEPFAAMARDYGFAPEIHLHKAALGATVGTAPMIESTNPTMSSMLETGPHGWGSVRERHYVRMTTVDAFCQTHSIERIDVLKIDAQGYEREILKGASRMFAAGAVETLFLEIIFADLYVGMPAADELMKAVRESGFHLVAMYDISYRAGRAGWTNAVFRRGP